jgi:hypothetical protein
MYKPIQEYAPIYTRQFVSQSDISVALGSFNIKEQQGKASRKGYSGDSFTSCACEWTPCS